MKINCIGDVKIVQSNPQSIHNYFGWPSVVRLKNGNIAVGSSGFRLHHICPFGKSVISISENEGETYTVPMPVIDTVLDDRDTGLCPFGKSGLIVTSFNNTIQMQRDCSRRINNDPYILAYLDKLTPQQESEALGSVFKISNDNGVSYGEMYKSPVTSPHGPIELKNGNILWVGRTFSPDDSFGDNDEIRAYYINVENGSMEYISSIEPVYIGGKKEQSCEPFTVQLNDGTVICHIRVQNYNTGLFTIFQTESYDNGKTWVQPHQIIADTEGAPSHMLEHSSGTVICTYGHRNKPYGIHVIFSNDGCKSWSEPQVLCPNEIEPDLGYPQTVELNDGSLLTVFYAHVEHNSPAVILQQKWRLTSD